jgi:hypothetical protein
MEETKERTEEWNKKTKKLQKPESYGCINIKVYI